ncbi:MAG: PEP-CTERM sorting domain-containing protein [Bacillota bacterium]
MTRVTPLALVLAFNCLCCVSAHAAIIRFFDNSQVAVNVAAGATSDTIMSNGYLFTYTRDKLFTGGIGMVDPIGRPVRIPWPQGAEAQAVTAGPNPGKATIAISRVDGDVFDLTAFTAKLLANTAGAGGSIEIMPKLSGEDGLPDPLSFNATGIAGNSFSYDRATPSYMGNTTPLKGFDTYTVTLYVDFALTGLTLEGAAVPEPSSLVLLGGIGVLMTRRRSA